MSPGSAALPPSPVYPSILSPSPLPTQYNVERGYTKGFTVSTLSVGWEEGLGGCSLAAPRACNYVSLWNLNSTPNSPEGPRRLSCQISANQRDTETSANIKNHEKNVPKVMTSLLMSSPPITCTSPIVHLICPPKFGITLFFIFPGYYRCLKRN